MYVCPCGCAYGRVCSAVHACVNVNVIVKTNESVQTESAGGPSGCPEIPELRMLVSTRVGGVKANLRLSHGTFSPVKPFKTPVRGTPFPGVGNHTGDAFGNFPFPRSRCGGMSHFDVD